MVDVEKMYERKMLRLKYSKAYFSALAKIQVKDMQNYSLDEYKLTPEENEALVCYINDYKSSVSRTRRNK